MRSIVVIAARMWLAVATCVSVAVADDGAALPPEASAVLGMFVGQWETQARIQGQGASDRTIEARGRAEGRWTLGGRFVEFHTESVPPGQSELQIMTYDEAAKAYRQWVFDSDGYMHEAVGTWDPATSTIVWRGQAEAGPFVIDDHWPTPRRLEWQMRRIAANGELVTPIEGVLTRTD